MAYIESCINLQLNLGTLIAQGDIGVKNYTAASRRYAISSCCDCQYRIGNGTIYKRVSGASLLEDLLGTATQMTGNILQHIHLNSAAEVGDMPLSLSPVIGLAGKRFRHILRQMTPAQPLHTLALLEIGAGYIKCAQNQQRTWMYCSPRVDKESTCFTRGILRGIALPQCPWLPTPLVVRQRIQQNVLSGASLLELPNWKVLQLTAYIPHTFYAEYSCGRWRFVIPFGRCRCQWKKVGHILRRGRCRNSS